MRRDDVLAMKRGRELDELACRIAIGCKCEWRPRSNPTRLWRNHAEFNTWELCPSYSTDAQAAHWLVEEVGGWWCIERSEDGRWVAQCGSCSVFANNAAEAITKAAIIEALEIDLDGRATS